MKWVQKDLRILKYLLAEFRSLKRAIVKGFILVNWYV